VLSSFFEDNISLFEGSKLNSLCSFFELLKVKSLLKLRLVDQPPDNILQDDIFQAIPQTSFDILATHRNDLASRLRHKRIGPDASLNNRILAKAIHRLELVVFFLDLDYAFLDDVEGVGVVALVENGLFFFVGFGETAASKGILLVLGQIFEESEHF
jgi:hypothetical protein